jgi:hypothetical protein
MRSVLSGKEAVIHKNLRDDLIKQFDKRRQNNLFKEIIDDSTYVISSTDILKIENVLGKQVLNNVLIRIDTLEVSLRNFIRALVFTHSKIVFNNNSSREFVQKNLSEYIQKLILFEEAKKLEFDTSEEVQSDLKIWSDYFSFEAMRSAIADTINITDEMIAKEARHIYKNTSDSSFLDNETKRKLIRNRLIDKKISRTLKYETAELSKGTPIQINYGLLQGLETSHINSFSIRRLGFGGTLPAAPIYFPNSGWVNPENYKQFILP